jgi:MFS family permease
MKEITKIQWPQLASLAALYASVVIGWIAYYNYQPILLKGFNLEGYTFYLFIVQGIILVVTPPLAGRLGDKYRKKAGHRLPIISAGISFAAMVFMAVAFTVFINPEPGLLMTIVLPGAITMWLISMSIFTSPAISTVEMFAPKEQLPTAMAVITLVSGLVYALEPVIVDVINYIGAPLTFAAGGVAVALSGYALMRNSKDMFSKLGDEDVQPIPKSRNSDYVLVITLGVAVGIVTSILFNLFPDRFETAMDAVFGRDVSGAIVTTVILALSAILAIPMGKVAQKIGLNNSVRTGVILLFLTTLGILFMENNVAMMLLLVVFAVAYTLASVSALPLAMEGINIKNKVLGVGFFYAGFELPNSILEAYLVSTGAF